MEELLKWLESYRNWFDYRLKMNGPDMNFGQTRLFLGVTKAHLRRLTKGKVIPFHNRYHKSRVFNKKELNLWMAKICLQPENQPEKETGEYFLKRKRVQ
jgi:hypothetical protein